MELSNQSRTSIVALPQDREPRNPLTTRLGVPQSRSGRFGEQKNLSLLQEIKPQTVQAVV
jgi:hypothetical protein